MNNILLSKIVLGESEKNLIEKYLKDFKIKKEIILSIPIKETFFYILNFLDNKKEYSLSYLKTTNDLLRYICFINEIDYNNIPKHKVYIHHSQKYNLEAYNLFKVYTYKEDIENKTVVYNKIKLKTSEKNIIMLLLNEMNKEEVLNSFKSKEFIWKSIKIALYPFKKSFNKYPNAQFFFKQLHNIKKVDTFNSKLTNNIKSKKINNVLELLKNNTGYLIRNLDFIIRNSELKEIKKLQKILLNSELNSKLILEIIPYLNFRIENKLENRLVNIKGKIQKLSINKNQDKLDKNYTEMIIETLNKI